MSLFKTHAPAKGLFTFFDLWAVVLIVLRHNGSFQKLLIFFWRNKLTQIENKWIIGTFEDFVWATNIVCPFSIYVFTKFWDLFGSFIIILRSKFHLLFYFGSIGILKFFNTFVNFLRLGFMLSFLNFFLFMFFVNFLQLINLVPILPIKVLHLFGLLFDLLQSYF